MRELVLSKNLLCSIHSSWVAGSAPSITVTGKCLLFNKTGLPLRAGDRATEAPLWPGSAAVLATEAEVRIGVGTQAPRPPGAASPQKAQELELRAPWQRFFNVSCVLTCFD